MKAQENLKQTTGYEPGNEATVEEIVEFEKNRKEQKHVYGKYGTLAKIYLEEHNPGKYWALAGDLPQYLHGIDEAAERLWETMNEKLSKDERYKHTGDYLSDVKKENEKKQIIEEEILSSIVYVG